MKQKKLIAGVIFLAMLFVAPIVASASDNATAAYNCYVLNQSSVFETGITFQPEFQLDMSGVFANGTGLYFVSSGLFVGIYWALDVEGIAASAATDVIIVMIGTATPDFIVGTGIMLVDYVAPSGIVFFVSAATDL